MYLVAGLGNPGSQYEMTRHNIGFHKIKKLKFKALYGECEIAGEKVFLAKPQTYMNLSGDSIAEFASFYKIPTENIVIISDDIALAAGKIRIRAKGSAGGHNGLKSIIYRLNSDAFARVRIGVGQPEHEDYDLADYVLGRFSKEEIPILENSIIRSYKAVCEIIENGTQSAMNKFN